MKFDIITIFPEIFDSYFQESIIKRALKKGLIRIKVHNLRKWTKDRHQTVDDKPYGGGIGMVLKIEPIYKAVSSILRNKKLKTKNKKDLLLDFDRVLGLGLSQVKPFKIPEEIKKLVAKRETLRGQGKWAEADKLRVQVEEQGFKIEDTEKGPRITAKD